MRGGGGQLLQIPYLYRILYAADQVSSSTPCTSLLAPIPADAALAKRYDIACQSDLRLTLKVKYGKIHKNI
jgi:hypothetical protein